jgi:hypothetical protein
MKTGKREDTTWEYALEPFQLDSFSSGFSESFLCHTPTPCRMRRVFYLPAFSSYLFIIIYKNPNTTGGALKRDITLAHSRKFLSILIIKKE